MSQVELIVDAKASLGEGPCWDEREAVLYWVDIAGKRVHRYDPAAGSDKFVQLDQMVGAAVVREGGGLMLALEHGFHTLDWESGSLSAVADPEPGRQENRFNDGKCDPGGRFFAGTMNREETALTGKLYRLDPDRSVHELDDGITTSNGLAWSLDSRTFYYIDSPTRRVFAYDYDAAEGTISGKRTIIQLAESEGFPDGMTIDAEGMLWIAQWDGHKVSRWNPHTGERLSFIEVPAARVTSCVFGGPELDELYITTARIGLSGEALSATPHAGGVFKTKPGVKGLRTERFRG